MTPSHAHKLFHHCHRSIISSLIERTDSHVRVDQVADGLDLPLEGRVYTAKVAAAVALRVAAVVHRVTLTASNQKGKENEKVGERR